MRADVRDAEVVVVGGGQAALAMGYYLRRADIDSVIFDDQSGPGGAWRHAWPSLRLFSPASYSSLPGWMMPLTGRDGQFPDAAHVVDYLSRYEERYQLPVVRPVRVTSVHPDPSTHGYVISTDSGQVAAQAVVNATGTWSNPFVPDIPGRESFSGRQIHTAEYDGPAAFAGQRVAVFGGGNSGAQILAELSNVADTIWVTHHPPRFLPDDVDGRVLFQVASRQFTAALKGEETRGIRSLGDIVMVPPVRDARARGILAPQPPVAAITPTGISWPGPHSADVDAIVWCTGFRPAIGHLSGLHVLGRNGRVTTTGDTSTKAADAPGIYLVGYGDWTGAASATIVGAGRTARVTVRELAAELDGSR